MSRKCLFEQDGDKTVYRVPYHPGPVSGVVTVPGSKSMTNRALLMAAAADGISEVHGIQLGDDSRHFIGCLRELGIETSVNENEKTAVIRGCGGHIPKRSAEINVGSAGTAARFLTALLAFSDGEYTIRCSEQMSVRPMKPLFRALAMAGASFTWLGEEGYLPVIVRGNGGMSASVSLDISTSTQYLSALLLTAPVLEDGIGIRITGDKKEGSYVRITMHMLEKAGVHVAFSGDGYIVSGGQKISSGRMDVEPDVSGACYFYTAAAITGGDVTVRGIHKDSVQGDMKYLTLLSDMGCSVTDTAEGIRVTGPAGGRLKAFEADMNDYSDQAMTAAAAAAYADGECIIKNVAHIAGQECDRMNAIVSGLASAGVKASSDGENIRIIPGRMHTAVIETYKDHRIAMSMSLLGLRTEGIGIADPQCCTKTFEDYFEVLDTLLGEG
jgi:3-phosphoshikimate 1-carboxyvinyltransferase